MRDDNEKLHFAQGDSAILRTNAAAAVAALYTPINTGRPTRDLEMDFEKAAGFCSDVDMVVLARRSSGYPEHYHRS